MYINSVQIGRAGPVDPSKGRQPQRPGTAGDGATPNDRVQISGDARALARQYATEGLTAERIGALRERIERGTYPEPQILEELAWRLIETGVV